MEQLPPSDPARDPGAGFGPAPVTSSVPPAPPRPRRSTLFSGSAILVLAALVAVGGMTFAIGRLTAPTSAAAARGGNGIPFGNGVRPSGAPGNGRAGGFGGLGPGTGLTIRGTVSSITADTLTLTLASGATVEIPLVPSTTYHDQATATRSNVQTGREVLVQLSGVDGGGSGGAGASPAATAAASASPGASTTSRLGAAQDVTVVAP